VEDLLLLDEALYTDKLIGAELRKKMFTAGHDNFGYGWVIRPRFGHPSVAHGGALPGFRSNYLRFPDDHLFVAVLGNTEPIPGADIANELAAIALAKKAPVKDNVKEK
jgi:CubicO group peptidase (beta-lactamase class C family)